MNNQSIANEAVSILKSVGADKASCMIVKTNAKEININDGKITLLRNVHNQQIVLKVIKNHKEAYTVINRDDLDSIKQASSEVIKQSLSSQADVAYDLWSTPINQNFSHGTTQMDDSLALSRMKELIHDIKTSYPTIRIEEAILQHKFEDVTYHNSEGVTLSSKQGFYEFMTMFTAKDGKLSSSFNYVDGKLTNLDTKLIDCFNLNESLKASSEQLYPKTITENFIGEIITAPSTSLEFVSFLESGITTFPLLDKTSVYKESLGKLVADAKLTLTSNVLSDDLPKKIFFSGDGRPNQNATIVKDGILQHYLIGLYGHNKLKEKLPPNTGDAISIEAGDTELQSMIKNTKRGILLNRFSGGRPASNGDFSGIAKNSFYIENGKIQFALTETMISGNLKQMLLNIDSISKEQVNYGQHKAPWIKFTNINISGK